MLLRVRASSFVTGLRGLALLRRWPYGDASRRFEEGAPAAPGSQSDTGDFLDIEQMDVGAGYEQWAVTYDTLPNPLLAAEQPAMTRLLQRFAVGIRSPEVIGLRPSLPRLGRSSSHATTAGALRRWSSGSGCQ